MSQYATIDQLFSYGMPREARSYLTDDVLNDGLVAASAVADSYLGGRYVLPLVTTGDEIPMYVCWIAAFIILSGPRGYNPAAGADPMIEGKHDKAVEWFKGVQAKNTHPTGLTPSPGQEPAYSQPRVLSRSFLSPGRYGSTRGW